MACHLDLPDRSIPHFKCYDEFTEQEKLKFKELYKKLRTENDKRNNIYGWLRDFGEYGYELLGGIGNWDSRMAFRTENEDGESYRLIFKVNKKREISIDTEAKSDLNISDELYFEIIDFLETIVLPKKSLNNDAVNRRKHMLSMLRKRRVAGKRKTYKKHKLSVRQNKYTRNKHRKHYK
jgi:hypothetical protein